MIRLFALLRSSSSTLVVVAVLLLTVTEGIFCFQFPFVLHHQASFYCSHYYHPHQQLTTSATSSSSSTSSYSKQVIPTFQLWMTTSPTDSDSLLSPDQPRRYELGLGKNKPLVIGSGGTASDNQTWSNNENSSAWIGPILPLIEKTGNRGSNFFTVYSWANGTSPIKKYHPSFATSILHAKKKPHHSNKSINNNITPNKRIYKLGLGKNRPLVDGKPVKKKNKALVGFDEQSHFLSRAVWNEDFFVDAESSSSSSSSNDNDSNNLTFLTPYSKMEQVVTPKTIRDYKYDPENVIDTVWQVMRYEAMREAQREPLLVSFLYSTILNHETLESALAFHLANLLSSPAMISTQVMSLCLEAIHTSRDFRQSLRRDILAVRDRDPACTCLPDVFLYFKGFHALQTYRVAHYLWKSGRTMLASHLQSQMSQVFQVDIHPNATLGHGIMLDHGTGIVIGGTAVVGHNCSILHHVTLGGTGKTGVDRHPKIGDGVLLGAGASILGNIRVGDGCQIGAGTLVIQDLPPHSVVVGVPAKIIGSFINVDMQPSLSMNQTLVGYSEEISFFETGGLNI